MGKEFGHIIKKKVENSSPEPPAMDWEGLSNAQNSIPSTPPVATGLSIIAKTGIIALGVIAVSVTSFFLFYNESEPNELKDTIQKEVPEEIKKIEIDTVSTLEEVDTLDNSLLLEKKPEVFKKKPIITPQKQNKKDKFESTSKENKVQVAPNNKTESTTTTIYEVDTVTTETYIYE